MKLCARSDVNSLRKIKSREALFQDIPAKNIRPA